MTKGEMMAERRKEAQRLTKGQLVGVYMRVLDRSYETGFQLAQVTHLMNQVGDVLKASTPETASNDMKALRYVFGLVDTPPDGPVESLEAIHDRQVKEAYEQARRVAGA